MNPLQILTQLDLDETANEIALSNGIAWTDYIKEDIRIAHERRIANLRLFAQMQTEIMQAKQSQMRERHLVRLGGLI
jgi:hypothetical protein